MLLGPKVTATLAQFAQALPNGTVNIMGAGLVVIPPKVPVIFIAGSVQFGWAAIGSTHTIRIELVDDDGSAVAGQDGEPVAVDGQANVAPLPGIPFGTPLSLPLAIPVTPPELEPGTRYEFTLAVDGQSAEDWSLPFLTTTEAQPKAA
jgi:hypothetical protein